MSSVSVRFDVKQGCIKPVHGVGQPPLKGVNTDAFHYLDDANIPYSRLHDVGGWFGGNLFVDIPNIFRDFNADAYAEASYDFTFADLLINALIRHHCMPIFRLGVTIENFCRIRSYRINPPEDFQKWAAICEHIIRHYNEGWANGFFCGIEYWEIWNEPDNSPVPEENPMWRGSAEQFLSLYKITAVHLRRCFGERIKIGGYGSCGFYWVNNEQLVGAAAMGKEVIDKSDWQKRIAWFNTFFERFIEMVKRERLPLDFFSHHSYAAVEDTLNMESYLEGRLDAYGLTNVEIHLNEWNPNARPAERGTSAASANAAAFLIAMHATRIRLMCYYDARIGSSVYGGLFHPATGEPYCTYYVFQAFGRLYAMGTQTECTCTGDGLYAIAAKGKGKRGVLIANTGADTVVKTNLSGAFTAWLIDEKHLMREVALSPAEFTLPASTVVYLECKT